MAALSEMSETIDRLSHIITYLMLPFSGVFIPIFSIPAAYRHLLLLFPLVDAVEYLHYGYYGARIPTYWHITYTIFTLTAFTLFSLCLTNIAIRRSHLFG
jgi:capsular polysaccharide transport system permease protein